MATLPDQPSRMDTFAKVKRELPSNDRGRFHGLGELVNQPSLIATLLSHI